MPIEEFKLSEGLAWHFLKCLVVALLRLRVLFETLPFDFRFDVGFHFYLAMFLSLCSALESKRDLARCHDRTACRAYLSQPTHAVRS